MTTKLGEHYLNKLSDKTCNTNRQEHESPEFRFLFHLLSVIHSEDLSKKKEEEMLHVMKMLCSYES